MSFSLDAQIYFDNIMFISGQLQVGHMQRVLDINRIPIKDEPVTAEPAGETWDEEVP